MRSAVSHVKTVSDAYFSSRDYIDTYFTPKTKFREIFLIKSLNKKQN
ncbi:hypothetical protein X975_09012, partial [Stegodyphus mimosarum]